MTGIAGGTAAGDQEVSLRPPPCAPGYVPKAARSLQL
ncbi:hypothetical protein ABIE65_002756 [Constrictibacter sp. MBR-5]